MGIPTTHGSWTRSPVGGSSPDFASIFINTVITSRAQAPVVGAPIHELTSSAAATIDLPFLFATEINGAFRSNILSWSWSRTGGRVVEESVITFLLESSHGRGNGNWVEDDLEHKASERRLVMGLYTAQRQRRALRMTDGFVFGALLSHAVMDIYVAYWRDDTLVRHCVPSRLSTDSDHDEIRSWIVYSTRSGSGDSVCSSNASLCSAKSRTSKGNGLQMNLLDGMMRMSVGSGF